MNRGQIRTIARKRLGETTAAFWQDPELNDWINLAAKDAAEKTKCLQENGYITTIENQSEYVLATEGFSTLIAVINVYLYQDATTWQKLKKTSRDELDIINPGWLSYDAGTPAQYYWNKEEDILGLLSKPNSTNAGTNYLRLYYAVSHADMTQDTNVPTIPADLHLALVDYVVSLGLESRGHRPEATEALTKYTMRLKGYIVRRGQEDEEDQDIIMKNYRNI